MSHKPYAIFQFGPKSTRYEILPPACPFCQKAESGQSIPHATSKPAVKVTVEVCHE